MGAKTRNKAKRKIMQSVGNLETAKIHINDFLDMGYDKYDLYQHSSTAAIGMIEETQKHLLMMVERI